MKSFNGFYLTPLFNQTVFSIAELDVFNYYVTGLSAKLKLNKYMLAVIHQFSHTIFI